MKKLFVSFAVFALLIIPNLHFAAAACAKDNVDPAVSGLFATQFCSAGDLIAKVITILLGLISMVAVVVIILGGYKYVTSQGNAENATAARKQITSAVIGLIVAVLAYTVVAVVNNTIISSSPASSGASTSTGSGTNTNGNSNGTSGGPTSQQVAAMARIVRGVGITGDIDPADQSGNAVTNHFTVSAQGNSQDLIQFCPDLGANATMDATMKIPLSGGGTSDLTSSSPNFDSNNSSYNFTMQFDNQDSIPSQPYASTGTYNTDLVIKFDSGCTLPLTVTKNMSTIQKGGI